MKKVIILIFTVALGLVFTISCVPCVCAQETDLDEFTLEEITVTAQKREENQQKVPIAMEVVSGEDLVARGLDNVDEILYEISNVQVNNGVDGMRITLRGISDEGGNASDMQSSEPTVAINIDGSYNNMNTAGQSLFDVERVEVLFGPQSTMYASNSPGGIVNIITASPKTDKYSANASVEYGSFDLLKLEGAVNAPVFRDKIALRLAASKTEQDSWVSEDGVGTDTKAARLKTLYQATDNLSFTLIGNWSKTGSGGKVGNTVVAFADQDDVDDPWTPSGNDNLGVLNQNDRVTKGASADISWDTKFAAISLVPSYSESLTEGGDVGGPPTATEINATGKTTNEQKEVELSMSSPASFTLFTWIVGGTYYDSFQERTRDFFDPDTADRRGTMERESKAVFGNITVPIPRTDEKLRGTIGYRRNWDHTHVLQFQGVAGTTRDKEQGAPDWKYGLEYDMADNIMLYGNYASSYRMGGYLMRADQGLEELKSYTAGAKSRWMGNKLQLNVSGFFYDYRNRNVMSQSLNKSSEDLNELEWGIDFDEDGEIEDIDVTVDPLGGLDQSKRSQAVGDFESLGADVQANWIITNNDKLNVSVSYMDSTWTNLLLEYTYPEVWPTENYNGVTNIKSPKWSVSGGYTHNFNLWDYGILSPQIQMQYKSHYVLFWNAADDVNNYGYQEPYFQFNGNASFNHSSGKWSFTFNVKNITDYAVKSSLMWPRAGVANVNNYKLRISEPRSYSAVFSLKF